MAADTQPLVLVVEDDVGIAVLQRRRLERAGYRVTVANEIDTAMSALARGGVSVVVLDYRLGETTGLDLHRRMKAAGFEVPVILVSAAVEDAAVVDALRAGIRDVVVKSPDYLDQLPDAVRGVLAQASTAATVARGVQQTTVLVVEDDPGTAALERKQLERAGYAVKTTAESVEALDAVRQGEVTLAVIDLRLPGGSSGLELYEQLKHEGRAVPAILVTGFADQTVAIRALRLGFRDFVPKTPDFLDYLPASVDRVMAQVRVERKLAESELRLASIIATTLDAVLMCDAASRIILFNRAAEQIFQCTAADVVGQPIADLIPDLGLGAAAGGVRERRELRGLRQADRSIVPLEVSVTDVAIQDQRLFTVIARDITERRRSEAALREADRRKDEFLGMLAHELRNPLAAIMNAGEVLHRVVTDARGQKLVAVVRRQTRALSRMVDDLLDISRVTLGKIHITREPLLLSEVVTRAVDGARQAATTAGVAVDVQLDPEPIWLEGDSTRLEQVVANLLTNAVKFTPAAGRVDVGTAVEDGHAVLRVRDTGVGIAPELLPRIFDLFVQGDTSLDRSRSGLGIGLSLVRQIVSMHGGTVQVTSDGHDTGSEFVIRLPLSSEHDRAADASADAAPAGSRLRVIVVDDQRDIADSVAMLVETLGHDVHVAYDAETALALMREHRPDAMIADIGMPGMTGYQLAEQVRGDAQLADVQLVALTGYGRDDDRTQVLGAGFNLHLTKPVTDAQLHAALEMVAARMARH